MLEPYHLFAAAKDARDAPAARKPAPKKRRGRPAPAKRKLAWSTDAPVRAKAMVLAGQTLLLAGTPNLGNSSEEAQAASAGRKGALLLAVLAADGAKLTQYTLPAPPVFDGMIAANGRLLVAMTDGSVACLAGNAAGEGPVGPASSGRSAAGTRRREDGSQ